MSLQDDPAPSLNEIESQLIRVLRSETFRSRPTDASVLELIVTHAMDRNTLNQKLIRDILFPSPPYDPDNPLPRIHVNFVRTLLKKYYNGEGRDDPILISLPVRFKSSAPRKGRGDSYPALFSYNPLAETLGLFKIGQHHLAQLFPASIVKATEAFKKILDRHPSHFRARIARMESFCILTFYTANSSPRQPIFEAALTQATHLAENNPHEWRAFVALAVATLLCNRDLESAQRAFLKAFQVNAEEPGLSLWLAALLLASGKTTKATQTSLTIAARRSDDVNAWAAHAFYLYFERNFVEAEVIFLVAIGLDVNCWLAHLGLAFVFLSVGKPKKALDCYLMAVRRTNDTLPIMPGVGILAAYRASQDDSEIPTILREQVSTQFHSDHASTDYIQVALTVLELNQTDAVRALNLAVQHFHPLVLLLHVWPIFDPLRDRADFQEILDQLPIQSK